MFIQRWQRYLASARNAIRKAGVLARNALQVGRQLEWRAYLAGAFLLPAVTGKVDSEVLIEASGIAAGQSHWRRFDAGAAEPMRLIQMAEQLEGPEDVLRTTYSNSTWQNKTFDAARSAARGSFCMMASEPRST